MYDFFTSQMDYIYFLYGLAFIVLGVSCLNEWTGSSKVPWALLGLFGVTHGALEWLEMISLVFGDSTGFHFARIIVMLVSFVFLTEFGRCGIKRITGKGPGLYFTFLLLTIGLMGSFAGLQGLNVTSRYALGLVGGLLSAITLIAFREGQPLKVRRWLTVAGVSMVIYSLLSGVVTPEGPFFPASVINQNNFFEITGIPIQLLRALAAVCISVSLAFVRSIIFLDSKEGQAYVEVRVKYTQRAAMALFIAVCFCWAQTQVAEYHGERRARENLAFRVLSIQSAIHTDEVSKIITNTTPDLIAYNNLKSQLVAVKERNKDLRDVYVMTAARGNLEILATADSSLTAGRLPVIDHGLMESMKNIQAEEPFIVGPYSSSSVNLVSAIAPLGPAQSGETAVYVGIDVDAEGWEKEISLSRFNAIVIALLLSILILMLTMAWGRNKEAALKITKLQIQRRDEEQEENLRMIITNLGEGVYVLDEKGVLIFLNPAGEKLLGWSQAELMGKRVHEIIHHEKPDRSPIGEDQCPILRVIETGGTCRNDEDIFVRKDGTTFPVAYVSTPLIKNGVVTGSITVFRDITDSRNAQQALRESEERYRTLFEKNSGPILVIDAEGNYIAGNQAALDFLEVSLEKLLSMNVGDTLPPGEEEIIKQHKKMWDIGGVVETPYYVAGRIKTLEMTINPAVLSGRKVSFAMGKDVTKRKEAEEKIKFMAYHDALTDLPNRALFKDRLRRAMDRVLKEPGMFAVLFMDLDRFKLINDTVGHSAGDDFLQVIASRLVSCIREEDTVSRQGGDEFAILLSRIRKPQDAVTVAKKILKKIQKPVVLNNREFQTTASIGITLYPQDGEDIETLLKNADITMYRAKEAGGNNCRLYTPSMNVATIDRMEKENSLREALEREEFEVYYQPQVCMKTCEIVGLEALLRWNHPTRGIVLPADFIPVAEETGFILPIGEWVLKTACTQVKRWHDNGRHKFRVSVNLSARQFRQKNLTKMVVGALHEAKLAPSYLELEITETTAMQNIDYSISVIRELKEMGVRISLDDFGVGYCSLSYLKRFPPIDSLKIDRSFIEDLSSDPDDKSSALVSIMIALAQKLNLRVIAEGVETHEQLAFLKHQNCDELQGYLFSKPLSAPIMEELLTETAESQLLGAS